MRRRWALCWAVFRFMYYKSPWATITNHRPRLLRHLLVMTNRFINTGIYLFLKKIFLFLCSWRAGFLPGFYFLRMIYITELHLEISSYASQLESQPFQKAVRRLLYPFLYRSLSIET